MDIEKRYKTGIDNWLCNMYFGISKKDTLANPYSVQLVLDAETEERHARLIQAQELQTAIDQRSSAKQLHAGVAYGIEIGVENWVEELPNPEDSMLPDTSLTHAASAATDKKKDIIAGIMGDLSERGSAMNNEGHEGLPQPMPRLVRARDFDEYTYYIPRVELKSGVMVSHKLLYIIDEALSGLGFQNVCGLEFWMSLSILLLAMWIRAYIHTFGSWLYLKAAGVPVNQFDLNVYGLKLGYASERVGDDLGVMMLGNLGNTCVFCLLALMAWLLQLRLRRLPQLLYKFVASYGIALVLDSLLLAIVDCVSLVRKYLNG
jgi:hypothetical protein